MRTSTETLLEIDGLHTAYGSSQILFGIQMKMGVGETATLLGRNGMGKTTTVRSIFGLTRPTAGTVRFCGERIDHLSPDRIGRMGMAVVPEGRMIFANLSVEENLRAFAANRSRSQEPWTLERVYDLFPRLKERSRNMGNQLSGGEQQMLAIGRALLTNPHLLILDEATEGLAPLIREDIWRCLSTLRAHGQSILVIDKYVQKLVNLADHHTIIERGKVVWQGDSVQLGGSPDVWHRYVGV
ncbi:MAG: ABC transporter ATP-binding protein [Rhodoferax sp.]|nr:ABC transporter ATP-binding protein [Rhodoferax sp.]MDP3650385.1 ABC transporter ATP-binding protein [Rhodoferax sp.]